MVNVFGSDFFRCDFVAAVTTKTRKGAEARKDHLSENLAPSCLSGEKLSNEVAKSKSFFLCRVS